MTFDTKFNSSFILIIEYIGVSIILIMGDRHMIFHFHARNKYDRYVLSIRRLPDLFRA